MSNNSTAVIIPAYNEAKTIGKVIKNIKTYVKIIVVVNDGSTDKTKYISSKNGAFVINLKKNLGVDNAIEQGFKFLSKKRIKNIITFDADAQHKFSDFQKVLRLIKNPNLDFVITYRKNFPRFSEKLFSLYSRKRFKIYDLLCGMKAYKLKFYKDYGFYNTFNSIGSELAAYGLKKNYRYKSILITVKKRKDSSRLGNIFFGNFKILKALFNLAYRDLLNVI